MHDIAARHRRRRTSPSTCARADRGRRARRARSLVVARRAERRRAVIAGTIERFTTRFAPLGFRPEAMRAGLRPGRELLVRHRPAAGRPARASSPSSAGAFQQRGHASPPRRRSAAAVVRRCGPDPRPRAAHRRRAGERSAERASRAASSSAARRRCRATSRTRGDRGRVARRRLDGHRRPRLLARRRALRHRPRQGRDHRRRPQHLPAGGRGIGRRRAGIRQAAASPRSASQIRGRAPTPGRRRRDARRIPAGELSAARGRRAAIVAAIGVPGGHDIAFAPAGQRDQDILGRSGDRPTRELYQSGRLHRGRASAAWQWARLLGRHLAWRAGHGL